MLPSEPPSIMCCQLFRIKLNLILADALYAVVMHCCTSTMAYAKIAPG
jgi:hypothetical protein